MDVAVAAPSVGVVSVGEVSSTTEPLPVVDAAEIAVPSPDKMPVMVVVSVIAGVEVAVATVPAKPLAETTETLVTVPAPAGVAHVPSPRQKVEDDAPVPLLRLVTGRLPVTPVESGSPVALVSVIADGVPRFGVTSVGLVASTASPEPVTANSPTVPALSYSTRPVVPPVMVVVLMVMPDDPAGVAHVPSPRQKVLEEAPVPELRFVTGRLPVTPVLSGRPVALVSTIALGVPRAGVTSVGDVARTIAPVPVGVVAQSSASVPLVVTGEPETLRSAGADRPTLVTVPICVPLSAISAAVVRRVT